MLIPIGAVKNIPVTVVDVSSHNPSLVEGHIVYFDGKAYQVKLPPKSPTFSVDEILLVDFGRGSIGRRRVKVLDVERDVVTLELVGRERIRDRRFYPRIEGQIRLEFMLVPGNEQERLDAWLSRPHLSDASAQWFSSEQEMEFSVTGFKLRAEQPVPPGTLLCMRFRLVNLYSKQYHAGGEVVRLEQLEDGVYAIAISLLGADDATIDALMNYTRACQDYVLGLDFMPEE